MVASTYSLSHIAGIIQAQVQGDLTRDTQIRYLLTDSRQVRFPQQALFFALSGPHHDGHDFIDSAYEQQIRYFVVRQAPLPAAYPDAIFLQVAEPLAALQQLAAHHRRQFDLPVIAITGSNGKTTVKEWLFQLLRDDYFILRSPRSYNSQVGVPLSIWPLQREYDLAILEAGISQPDEMAKLETIIQPTIGVLTHFGAAHDAGFRDRTEKLREKLLLFRRAAVIIYQATAEWLDREVKQLGRPVFCWSYEAGTDIHIQQVDRQTDKTNITAVYQGQRFSFDIPFTDAASTENAIHCLAVGLWLDRSPAVLIERMRNLTPIAMRMEISEARNGCTLINDSYNNDLQSLAIALDFARQQRDTASLTLILSDILQSGLSDEHLYAQIGQMLGQHRLHRLIGVGPRIQLLKKHLPEVSHYRFFKTTDDLLPELDRIGFQDELILLKGARTFAFERIAERLLPQTHRTVLEVNLSALSHNLRVFSSLLPTGVAIMVMVKAAAYGGGSPEIGRLLRFHGVSYLAVAYTDEGVALRQNGITLPILVLNPEPHTFGELRQYQLEPEVYSVQQLEHLLQTAMDHDQLWRIHIKLDSGMHRLGFTSEELPALIDMLQQNPQCRVASVFSHLAAGDDPSEDEFTHQQAVCFQAGFEQISRALGYQPLQHLLNSAGIARFPQYHLDMVRLGIGLYGVEIIPALQGKLRPVFRLTSRIAQIRQVPAGEGIGYGQQGRAQRERRIATVNIGYADGLLRRAGNGRYALLVHGEAAPTVGHICMDMCMIDVTYIPHAAAGDEVVVLGEGRPVEMLAQVYNTIPYEVLTGISDRVKRIYVQE